VRDQPSIGRRRLLLGAGADRTAAASDKAVAAIARSCLAFQGVACMACRDSCEAGAIRFTLAIGGARPRIDDAACTGCAACVGACPAGAIAVTGPGMPDAPHA